VSGHSCQGERTWPGSSPSRRETTRGIRGLSKEPWTCLILEPSKQTGVDLCRLQPSSSSRPGSKTIWATYESTLVKQHLEWPASRTPTLLHSENTLSLTEVDFHRTHPTGCAYSLTSWPTLSDPRRARVPVVPWSLEHSSPPIARTASSAWHRKPRGVFSPGHLPIRLG